VVDVDKDLSHVFEYSVHTLRLSARWSYVMPLSQFSTLHLAEARPGWLADREASSLSAQRWDTERSGGACSLKSVHPALTTTGVAGTGDAAWRIAEALITYERSRQCLPRFRRA
jgi:hypothetical protein